MINIFNFVKRRYSLRLNVFFILLAIFFASVVYLISFGESNAERCTRAQGQTECAAIVSSLYVSLSSNQSTLSIDASAEAGFIFYDDGSTYYDLNVQGVITNQSGNIVSTYQSSLSWPFQSFLKTYSVNVSSWSPGTYTVTFCADSTYGGECKNESFTITTPLSCSPTFQNVQVGQLASLTASGGDGTYSWSTSGGNPSSGSGSSFSTYYNSTGDKTVTVTSGSQSASCTVSVSSGGGGGGNPTASLDSNYNSILKGNSVTLSWSSTNADRCDPGAGAGFETNGLTSGSDGVSALAGDTTFSIKCYKDSNGNGRYDSGEPSAQANKTVTVFTHSLHVDAALYSGGCNQGTADPIGNTPVSITLNQKPNGANSSTVSPGIYGVWGGMPKSFSITNASAGNYVFCGSSPSVSFDSISSSQSETLTAFFAPSGGSSTYVISPSQGTISQCNTTFQFTGYYDPDGPSGSQPQQDVTNNATWSSSNELIAQYISPGKFKGINNGTVTITSNYNNIQATATLTVSGCGGTGGGNCTVTASPTSGQKPLTVSFTAQSSATAGGGGVSNNNSNNSGSFLSKIYGAAIALLKKVEAQSCPQVLGYKYYFDWTNDGVYDYDTGCPAQSSSTPRPYTTQYTYQNAGQYVAGVKIEIATGSGIVTETCTTASTVNGGKIKVYAPTLSIAPLQESISVGETTQFEAWYDPDGPDGPQGSDKVSSLATWSSSNSNIASSLGGGKFKGESAGSVTVSATYNNITANASLDVSDVNDFSVSISPSSQSVSRGGQVSYNITVSSIGNFSGSVSLSASGFASGLSGSPNPSSVSVSPNSSGESTLTINASDSAALGASSFTVTGTSGGRSHQDGATVIVDDKFSCTLSSKKIGSNQFEVSIDIKNGSGNYGCRFFGPGQNDIDYFNCSPRTYTVGSGDNTVKADVVDRNDASKTTSCSIDLGQGPPPPKTRSQLNFGFFRRDANNQWVYISWPQFGGKDKVNFSMNFDDSVLEINGERNLDYLGRINADEGTYTFRDWISPDNYVLDHIVYEGGTDSTHNSCRFTSAWNQSCTVKIYLRKTKTILDISSKIAPLEGDHPAVKCEGNRGKIICVCDFKYSNYLTGSKVVLSGPAGEVTLDNGKYEFSSSGSLRFGNYTVSQVNPLSGYKLVNPIGCNFVGGGSQNSSLESKRFLSGLFSFFGDGLSSLVRKALAFFQGPKGFWPESFSAEDGGDDVFLTIFLSESNDYCSLSASPTTVISGQYSTLQWECSKPDGKSCIVKDDSNNVVVDNANPSGGTEKVKVRKTTTYTLSCTGVDDSYVTVRVSFLKKIREIIPW